MPYKFDTEKKLIPRELKRSNKLTDAERKQIERLYGLISQRKLAKMFRVSRSLIRIVGDPEIARRQKLLFAIRQKTGIYYDKDKQTIRIRNTRRYKKELNKKGLLLKRN